jgi:hypothetical protein
VQAPKGDANPWRFLTALDGARRTDREIIKQTRAEELDIVNHMIMAAKTSVLYAASGNGKTSLINAGIIPYFVGLGFAVFRTRPRPPWCVGDPAMAFEQCMLREQWLPEPAVQPEAALAAATEQLKSLDVAENSPVKVLVTQLEAQLVRLSQTAEARSADLMAFLRTRAGTGTLTSFLRAAQAFLGPETRMLLICDQFEELFVHFSGTQKLADFVKQLGEICKNDKIKAQLLFSMREDWVGSMIEFRTAIPDIFSFYYKLAPIRVKYALPALDLPLADAGFKIEKKVADRILLDLADCFPSPVGQDENGRRRQPSGENSYLELPALQIVAEALWNSRNDKAVTEPFSEKHYEYLKDIYGHTALTVALPSQN